MKTIVFITLLSVLKIELTFCQIIESHGTSDSIISWTQGRKLTALDFWQKTSQMIDRPQTEAYSCLYMSSYYSLDSDTLIIKIIANFNKNSSWIHLTGQSMVSHEQGHFDLEEVEARMVRKNLLSLSKVKLPTEKDLDSLMQQFSISYDSIQDKYDLETEHSFNAIQQKKWDIFIANELKKLDPFKMQELRLYVVRSKQTHIK